MQENLMTNPQTTNMLLIAIAKKLENIETRLDKKVAYLAVEDAVNAYKKHLDEGVNKKGRRFSNDSVTNFSYFLERIVEHFPQVQQNVALVTTDECAEFLHRFWPDKEASTRRQRQNQLKIFFSFCIQYLKKKGSPVFHNPCDLLDAVEYRPEPPGWIPTETIKKFIDGAKREHHWLAFSIMATAGLRINDLMNLRRMDIDGRVLHLRSHGSYRPKSGKKEEIAVIPAKVAERLSQFVRDMKEKERIIPVTEIAIFKAVQAHGKALGLDIGNHSLRKWCASYYARKNEPGMENFVLRHSASKLRDRYVAPLTIEEAIDKQVVMEGELYES